MSHSSSIANLQTASKLILSSRLVYRQPLDLPVVVEVIRATPSAGKMLKLDTCSSEQSSVHKMDVSSETGVNLTLKVLFSNRLTDLENELMITRWGRMEEGIVRGCGLDMYTLLYLKWITNKVVLYSTGNSAQCYVAACMGGEFGGEWIHVYIWLSPFAIHLKLSQHC